MTKKKVGRPTIHSEAKKFLGTREKMTIENAIARSVSHSEVVKCEFTGEYSELLGWLDDNTDGRNVVSGENDGTIDVAGDDWRVNVTLLL